MSSIELLRHVLMDAADAKISRVQARARDALIEHHQLLALFKAPERRRQRADVHRLRRDVEDVDEDAPDLAKEHADVLRAARNLDAEQPLRREAEGVLLVHRRDVIEPVEIGNCLQVGLVFDQLLGAAMKEADMRIDALDDLAVEFEHEAQDAVRGRMLRPEIDGEVASGGCVRRGILHDARIIRHHAFPLAFSSPGSTYFAPSHGLKIIEIAELLHELHRLVDDTLLLVVVTDLDIAGQRKVLAQRIALEAVVGEQAAQVGWSAKMTPYMSKASRSNQSAQG